MDEANKIEFQRWPPVKQQDGKILSQNVKDPNSGKWYTDGEGTGDAGQTGT